jgi:hypothetical protein
MPVITRLAASRYDSLALLCDIAALNCLLCCFSTQFLSRLLLVHGRWNYNRICVLVCYMFYKNIALVMTQYWYQIFTGWSGQKFFLEAANQVYNIVRKLCSVAVASGAIMRLLACLKPCFPAHGTACPAKLRIVLSDLESISLWVAVAVFRAYFYRTLHSSALASFCNSYPCAFVLQLFTGLPVLLLGVFDQDIDAKTALAFPYLYIDGLIGKRLNLSVF